MDEEISRWLLEWSLATSFYITVALKCDFFSLTDFFPVEGDFFPSIVSFSLNMVFFPSKVFSPMSRCLFSLNVLGV
jgi:hypothetical protein